MSNFTTTGIVSATPTHPSIGWNNSWIVVDNNANRELYAQAMYVTNLDDLKVSLSAKDLVLDISAINLNTDGIEDLISNSNTFLNKLTAIKYATSDNQEIEITLLNQLTANNNISISLLKTLTSDDVAFTSLLKTLTADSNTQTTLLKIITADDVTTNTLLKTLTADDVVFTTLLKTLTSLQDSKQSEIITLLHQLTANTDTLEVNTDGVETLLNSLTSLQDEKQNELITLLHQLTANTDGLEINLDNIEINTDGVETILSVLTANDLVFTAAFKTLTSDNTIFTSAFNSLTSNLNTSVTLLRILTADNVTLTSLQKTISAEQSKATTLLHTITGDNVEIISVLNDTLSTLIGLTAVEILNPVTAVEVHTETPLPVSGAITILNPVTAVEVLNPVTAIEVTIDQVTLSNPVTAVTILNPVTSFSVDIENVTISNPVTAVTILNPVSSFSVDIENVVVSNPITAVQVINTDIQPLHFQYSDNGHLDAFSRLRVSTPTTLFDSKTLHNKSSLFWSQVSSGNGAYIGFTGEGTDASVTLSTLNTGEFAIRQTTQRFNYQPGKSQLALFTGVLKPEDHCIKRYGLFQSLTSTPFTPTVGLYFETQINSPSSIAVIQANEGYLVPSLSATRDNWNIDKLDGKGISGKTLSLSAANIFLIDFEWLGVGRVRYGAVIDGQICYCHQFNNAGNVQGAYIRTPNLPVRAEIRQLAYGPSQLKMICCSVMSEGGEDFTGVTRAIDSGTIGKNINAGVKRAILGARLQANKLDSVNEILNISGLVLASNSGNAASACFKYELLHNPTLASNGTWTDVDANSNFQEWQGVSEVLKNGTVITSGYSGAGGTIDLSGYRFEKFLRMGCTIDGRRDEIYLVITPLQANEGVFGSITFIESD